MLNEPPAIRDPIGPVAHPGLMDVRRPSADDESEGEGGGLERSWSAIRRCRWVVLLVTLIGSVGGFLYVRSMPLQYRAEATLWATGKLDSGPLTSNELYISTIGFIDLLRSNRVLGHVVRDERLYMEPASVAKSSLMANFELGDSFSAGEYRMRVSADRSEYLLSRVEGEAEVELERGAVGGPVGRSAGFIWTPPAESLPPDSVLRFEISTPASVARGLSGSLEPSITRKDGNFIRLHLTGTDPKRTAEALNAIAFRSSAVTAELKRLQVDDVSMALTEQLAVAEQRLRDAEIALENFRVQTATLPSDQPTTPLPPGEVGTPARGLNQYLELTTEQGKLREDRQAVELFLRQLAETAVDAPVPTLATTEATAPLAQAITELTAKQAALRDLRTDFTDEYPPVRDALADIRDLQQRTIPALGRSVLERMAEAESELAARIDAAEKELRDIPPRTIEESRLQRSVSIADNLHGMLKQRFEQSRLTAASSVPDLLPLDLAAVPRRPIEDKRLIMLLIAFGGSLGVSVAGALLYDRLDPRVRYPKQITRELGLPILGAVPHVHPQKGRKASNNAALVGEAFREVCFSVIHACGTARPLVLTVSSPEQGDGKSFIASNIALGFSRQGRRTLLLDGDLRRGVTHRLFDCHASPGLAEYLSGTATYEEILRETSGPMLITAGKLRMDAVELLNSQRMGVLMSTIRSSFDTIIIDGPPLAAGVDAYLLAAMSGEMLLVLRTGSTNRALAEAKLGVLDRLPIRLIGAVLNDVPPEENIYRQYSYLGSYHAEEPGANDDDGAPPSGLRKAIAVVSTSNRA